jgi:hypothetical protein
MTQGNNWDGYNHETLYGMIHGTPPGGLRGIIAKVTGHELQPGAGVAGAEDALQTWGELAALMDEARAETEAALADAGASWEGSAAESMRSGVTPLAQWAADANTAGTASQSSVDGHVASFSSAQNRMPEPVPVTSTANSDLGGIPATFTHLFGGQTDQENQEAAAQEAKAEAVRVMSGYEDESTGARSGVGTFVPPPSVTVQIGSPNPTGGEIGSLGGVFVGPSGGSGAGGRTRAGAPSSGTDGGAPPTGTTQGTTPEQAVPIGGEVRPAPVAPPEPVASKPVPQQIPFLPVGPGPRSDPVTGRPIGGGSRAPGGAGIPGRGPGGAPGDGGRGDSGSGRGGAGAPGGAGRGAAIGSGPLADGAAGGRAAAGSSGARAAGGLGMGPIGAAGRGQGAEDREHNSPAYLRDTHDDFWDDIPPVSPPVIGEE